MKESTKIKLFKAFELLYIKYNHNVELISVNELCNSCGVSRTTFYSYYATINEIFDEISEKILTVFNHLSDCILSYYIYKKKFDRKEIITELINIKTNQEFANYCFLDILFL